MRRIAENNKCIIIVNTGVVRGDKTTSCVRATIYRSFNSTSGGLTMFDFLHFSWGLTGLDSSPRKTTKYIPDYPSEFICGQAYEAVGYMDEASEMLALWSVLDIADALTWDVVDVSYVEDTFFQAPMEMF